MPTAAFLGSIFAAWLLAAAPAAADRLVAELAPYGRVQVATLPLPAEIRVLSATWAPGGEVLVAYRRPGDPGGRFVRLAVADPAGRLGEPFFAGEVPPRPGDNGLRFLPFPDDRRLLLGDFVLECNAPFARCTAADLLPIDYPEETRAPGVLHRWSEVVVAPDGEHIAWTTLTAAPPGALVYVARLLREEGGYRTEAARILSTLDPFVPDPVREDGVRPLPLRGGEVKQFVRGGAALSLVGAGLRELPDAVLLDLESGRQWPVTDTAGYTETAIFSPDERLGLVMTTRFSPPTSLEILGLVPRPYPDSLGMGLAWLAYTYGVTGVRAGRPGSIGPALVAFTGEGGLAEHWLDLAVDPDWVFYSPLSWHPGGRAGMWIEGRRGGKEKRVRLLRLPDYRPGPRIPPRAVPAATPGAVASAEWRERDGASADLAVRVYGRHSGHIDYRREGRQTEKRYRDFSDDGRSTWSGWERFRFDPAGRSVYEAELSVGGRESCEMELRLTFGPLAGTPPARLIRDPGADGRPASTGFAACGERRIEVDALAP